jgi:hypothetical protein
MLAGAGVVASPLAWHRDPQLVWEFYSMRRKIAAAAQPTPAPATSTAAPIAPLRRRPLNESRAIVVSGRFFRALGMRREKFPKIDDFETWFTQPPF